MLHDSSFPKLFIASTQQLLIFEHANGRWQVASKLEDAQPMCIGLDPFKTTRLYCGTFEKGLCVSDDSGQTWRQIAKGVIESGITSLAVSPNEQEASSSKNGLGVLYVGTEPSMLYRSEDGGESWKLSKELLNLKSANSWSFPPKPDTHHVRAILPDPAKSGMIYLAIEAGALIRSPDSGRTWKDRVPGGPYDTHNLTAISTAPGRIYSAAGDGYFESHDYGETWETPDEGLEQTYLYSVAVHPDDPDAILVSASEGPFTSYDARNAESHIYRKVKGKVWKEVKEGLASSKGTTTSALTANPKVKGEFYAANNTGIYKSKDAGLTWTKLDLAWKKEYMMHHVHCLLGQR